MRNSISGWLALVVAWIAFVGCGAPQATVTGRVTLDGQPLKTGAVSFHPAADGALAQGQIDSSGQYSLQTGTAKSLKPGSYRVTVVATEIDPPDPTRPSFVPLPRLLTPERYGLADTSGITKEVNSGPNTIDIELKTTP